MPTSEGHFTEEIHVLMVTLTKFSCFAGTTDSPCKLTDYPQPTEDDIQFILKEIRNYLSPDVDGKFYFYDT
jgi:glycerol-3-phosphate dehydrogenase